QQSEIINRCRTTEQLAREHPEVPMYRRRLVAEKILLALHLATTNALDEAEGCYRESLKLAQQLVEEFPALPVYRNALGISQYNCAVFLVLRGKSGEAEQCLRQGADTFERLAADYPRVPAFRSTWSQAILWVCMARRNQGDEREATRGLRDAMAVIQK